MSQPSQDPLVIDVRPAAADRWLATCECQQYAVCRSAESGWEWVLSHACSRDAALADR